MDVVRRGVLEQLHRRRGEAKRPVPGAFELPLEDARLLIARLHGFANWAELEAHAAS